MKIHNLTQGSPEWHAYRKQHFNASDAPAMMGCSAYKTRSQLLHELATGHAPEVDAATQRRFDDGHRYEALARPLAEKIIGQDLYPVVGSDGEHSASFDGLSMDESENFEHKSLNDELRQVFADIETIAPAYRTNEAGKHLPLQYRVQMEQQHMVSGADRTLFMASKWNGDELVEERHCWYETNLELRQQILQGWTQFAIDLAAYVPPEVIVPAVAAPQMGLPAVSITVNGSIALVDNLDKFGTALTAYVDRINKKPETDQDFADLEATVKTLKNAEEALDAAEANALAQTDSIDAMRRTVGLYRETARTNRLLIEKLVKAEKENRRIAIVSDAAAELVTHVRKLNERLGKPYMPAIAADFQGVIKGLKSLDSMKDKVAGELARCKIEANAIADRIQANLTTLRELASEHAFLFADTAQLVGKANDDLTALVKSRIADHKAAESAKEEATRERIRAEEQARAEREHAAKVESERIQREQAEQAQAARIREEQAAAAVAELAAAKAFEGAELSPAAQALYEAEGVANFAKKHPAAAAITHAQVVQQMPATVRQAMAPKPVAPIEGPPTLTLGEISTRLSFNVTSAFLATLGYEATTVKAAKLFHADDFPAICHALIAHIAEVSEQFDAVAA